MVEKGEKAELPTLGDVAEMNTQMAKEQNEALSKRTLKIWDVPTEMANKFIAVTRGSYANKSWLYLQDLMRKAEQYDLMVSSGKLEELERRVVNLEEFAKRMNDLTQEVQENMENEEAKKTPKTFGGDG